MQETSKFARTAQYVSLSVRTYSILSITISYRVHALRIESMASKNLGYRVSEYTEIPAGRKQTGVSAVRPLLMENMTHY